MATDIATRPVSTDEFLAFESAAGDDAAIELIDGEIREYPMTTRSPRHATTIARSSHELIGWLDAQHTADGEVAAGEVRCRIARDPDTTVGIDVAYFEGTPVVEMEDGSRYFDGPPVVAIEVLSPSDTHEGVSSRIRTLLAAGVRQVWVADPEFRTVTVHRTEAEPRLYAVDGSLDAGPELPGFRCPVEKLFGRPRRGS